MLVGLVALAALAACKRGPSDDVREEMARRERVKAFFRDYPAWSGPSLRDRSEPHLITRVASTQFEMSVAPVEAAGKGPGLLVCTVDVHPSRVVGDALSKPDFQLTLRVDGVYRRWCCSKESEFLATYANFVAARGVELHFSMSDKDLHRDDWIGSQSLEHDGSFPLAVHTKDFDVDCRWRANGELGPAIDDARSRAAEAMEALATSGGENRLETRRALQHLAGLVGWSDADLMRDVATYDAAVAAPAAPPSPPPK